MPTPFVIPVTYLQSQGTDILPGETRQLSIGVPTNDLVVVAGIIQLDGPARVAGENIYATGYNAVVVNDTSQTVRAHLMVTCIPGVEAAP
jgi:hypothetical protein